MVTPRQLFLHQPHPHGDAGADQRIVKVIAGVMQRLRRGFAVGAYPEIGPRTGLQHAGKIFGGHRRRLIPAHRLRAESGGSHLAHLLRLQRMVFGHRITREPANLALHIGHLRLGRHIAFDKLPHAGANAIAQAAEGTAQHHGVRQDVDRLAAVYLGDADHCGILRRQAAGRNGLQRHYQLRRRDDRIGPALRHRRMTALSAQGYLEGVQ